MTNPELIEIVSGLGDYPRKSEILEMIKSGKLGEAKALVRRLWESCGAIGPQIAPGVHQIQDTQQSLIYSRLKELLDDFIIDRGNS